MCHIHDFLKFLQILSDKGKYTHMHVQLDFSVIQKYKTQICFIDKLELVSKNLKKTPNGSVCSGIGVANVQHGVQLSGLISEQTL